MYGVNYINGTGMPDSGHTWKEMNNGMPNQILCHEKKNSFAKPVPYWIFWLKEQYWGKQQTTTTMHDLSDQILFVMVKKLTVDSFSSCLNLWDTFKGVILSEKKHTQNKQIL